MSNSISRDSAMNREQAASTTAESNPCDEALLSRQRQRYLASLPSEGEQQSDNQYREQ
ncbi:MAG: hypothetical protein KXJ50_09565 [Vulcanococcus sp.]|jgi:hypothetical protein|uniref:hypothetical protein n=1 Tax=Vulcanococcus sp. TaxID=2856995 RepID=UPI0025CD162C|nr:hypothetical protein [Vulcanococcus sp.]MBW0166829.1 hypothetical protein [Vulcanococcus sp.]MBW0174998.1 hypothetical protein [Vulcanococcus sp.]MBW0181301.1 hypothetical protein [Vulcanococcus sp.]